MVRRVRRSSGPLDLRSQAILRAVIEEYVTTAAPVGSHALVERYRLGVSSATVRAVLAELETAGLLTHPHTCAGRVPTEHGYRYYVESIVDAVPLPPVEQLMIRHQFGQVEYASEHWFRLAATTLASVTRAAGPGNARQAHARRTSGAWTSSHQRPARQPDPRPSRGLAQAGPDHARRPDGPGGAVRRRQPSSTTCSTACTAARGGARPRPP